LDGHAVDVLVNGDTIINDATVSTSFNAFPFSASSGDVIEVDNWVSGLYPSEVSWNITNTDGIIILSGGAMDIGAVTGNCPTCFPVSAIATTSVDTSSISIAWVAGATETLWNVEYGSVGFTQGTGTIVAVTDTNYSTTGLTSSTEYDFYVQADCGSGDVGAWIGPLTSSTSRVCPTNASCADFSQGIDSDRGFTTSTGSSTCPGSVNVVIPSGYVIDSVHTSYDFTATGGGWMSEQRSMLYSPTLMVSEGAVTNGSGNSTGTISYSRTTNAFNGGFGTVTIELHAGRSYGGSRCDNTYNYVEPGSWEVTAYYGLAPTCAAPLT